MDCPTSFTGVTGESFASFVNTLMAAQCALSSNQLYPSNYAPYLQDGAEFDFIVVGAGSAGSIVASRLSENPKWRVLLVEAGDYPSVSTEVPSMHANLARTEEDWNYIQESPGSMCLDPISDRCSYPNGKMLGGSGAMNAMIYIRGNRKDYDNWAAKGNKGWDYDSLMTHFKEFEHVQGTKNDRTSNSGQVKITKYVNDYPMRKVLIDAYKEVGFGEYTEEYPQGYLNTYVNIHNGTRCNSAKAFLPAMKNRKNAFLVLNTEVSKVIIDSDLTARAVEMRLNGRLITVKAAKEVILSTGAIKSPQILMNSGIGPKEHLEALHVPLVKNLRVGENLQDHVVFFGVMMSATSGKMEVPSDMDSWYQYLMHREGSFAKSATGNFMFFLNTKNDSRPNMQIYHQSIPRNDPLGGIKVLEERLRIKPEIAAEYHRISKESDILMFMLALTYTKSVGKVQLRSKDPFDKPRMFMNYFSDAGEEDLQAMLEGVRFFQRLTKTKALAGVNAKLAHLNLVNCNDHRHNSDEYWKCVIRSTSTTLFHSVGTCRMGTKDDFTAVVDSRLRVHGVARLRVADASIMPEIISCNTNAAAMMIGQKASQMIREDWTN